jgi:hypothetical protein
MNPLGTNHVQTEYAPLSKLLLKSVTTLTLYIIQRIDHLVFEDLGIEEYLTPIVI